MLHLGTMRTAERPNSNGRFLGLDGAILQTVLHISLASVTDDSAPLSRRAGEAMCLGRGENCVTIDAGPYTYRATYLPNPGQRTRMLRSAAVSTRLIATAMEYDADKLGGPLRQDLEVESLPNDREAVIGYTPSSPFTVELRKGVLEDVPLGELGAGGLYIAMQAQLADLALTGFCINQGEIFPWPASWIELTPHLPAGIE